MDIADIFDSVFFGVGERQEEFEEGGGELLSIEDRGGGGLITEEGVGD